MSDMLISVIVPVYNIESEYLERCIRSICAQTYKNLEILLVDDGSTDGVCPVAFAQLELGVVLPTAFTPHIKDGLNDVYMEGYEVIIFDRYGQKVFEGANGWDGTHRGVMADPGVYFSQVKLKNDKIVSGTIEIVKYD